MSEQLPVIDGDLLAFKASCFFEKEEDNIDQIDERLAHDMAMWTPGTRAPIVAFSCSRTDNYRRDFWPAYKLHRDGKPSPAHLRTTIQWIKDRYETVQQPRLEADDLLGYYMTAEDAICVTKDKDLKSVPGWFWDPEKTGFPVFGSVEEADRRFYAQWLTGDTTDNIPGIHRVGPAAANKLLDQWRPATWGDRIMDHYISIQHELVKWKGKDGTQQSGTRSNLLEEKYGWAEGHDRAFALAQARCIRILRAGELDPETWEPILWEP